MNWCKAMTPIFSWLTMWLKQKEIGSSFFDAYLATVDGSVPAIKYCVKFNYYHFEPMPVIPYEAEKINLRLEYGS